MDNKKLLKNFTKKNLVTYLDAGGDINATDSTLTPLFHHACIKNFKDIILYMVERGVIVDVKDRRKRDILVEYVSRLQEDDTDIVKILLDGGCDIDSNNSFGNTALHHSVRNNLFHVTKLLVERGADINARTTSDTTPLHLAIENNNKEIVNLLLDKGVDTNIECVVKISAKKILDRYRDISSVEDPKQDKDSLVFEKLQIQIDEIKRSISNIESIIQDIKK